MTTERSNNTIIVTLLAWALGGLFLYAGAIKISDPGILLADIEGYRLLPYELAWGAALFLPPFEIFCGLALFLPGWRRSAAVLLSVLMAAFTIALLSAWVRGLDIQCGCFGKAEEGAETNFFWLVGRDLAILAGLLFLVLRKKGTKRLDENFS